MAIREHPPQGSIVTVDYSEGFKEPEMVKVRLAVVLSPKIITRPHLCTVVPLSLTKPKPVMPYNKLIRIPFELPKRWGDAERWIKGDMVNAVGFHRVDLLRLVERFADDHEIPFDCMPHLTIGQILVQRPAASGFEYVIARYTHLVQEQSNVTRHGSALVIDRLPRGSRDW
jgi:mRNA interferase MazF